MDHSQPTWILESPAKFIMLPDLYSHPVALWTSCTLLFIHTFHLCSGPLAFLNTQVCLSFCLLPCLSLYLEDFFMSHLNGYLTSYMSVLWFTFSVWPSLILCLTLTLLLPTLSFSHVIFLSYTHLHQHTSYSSFSIIHCVFPSIRLQTPWRQQFWSVFTPWSLPST